MAVARYYGLLNNRQYELAWAELSDDFKEKFNCCAQDGSYDYAAYVAWWDSVEEIEIGELRVLERNADVATVYAQLSYTLKDGREIEDSKPHIRLVDDRVHGWLFDDKW